MSDVLETDSVRIAKLEQSVIGLSGQVDGLRVQLGSVLDKLSAIGRPNYMLLIGVVSVIIMLISGGYFIVQLSIKTEMAPIVAKAELSEQDRSKLNGTVVSLMDRTSDNRTMIATLGQQIVELETQSRAISQISNLQVSYEHTLKAILWREMKGYDLPPVGYFPDVTLPKPGASK